MNDTVHNGHRGRLKKRFLSTGLDSFDDHQVLELLLYYTVPRTDTNVMAHKLIDAFGSLWAVFEADYNDLLQVKGVGEHSASLIKLVAPLAKRYLDDKYSEGYVIDQLSKAGSFMHSKFIGKQNEVVILACLDNKRRVIYCRELFEGSVNAVQISVRKIVECAIRTNASCVVVAHNHPNGIALPSGEDLSTTKKIQSALDLLGITLLDHIIVASDDYVSLAESGQIGKSFIY